MSEEHNNTDYDAKAMLAELDHLVARSGDEQSQLSWLYIKHIVTRGHAHFLKEEFGLRGQKAVNQAWSDWEDGFENDPAEFPSEYLMNSLASLWNDSAPIKHPGEWGFWLEVALGLGRGIPRKEAIEDQNKFLAEQGGYEAFYGHPNPRVKKRRRKSVKPKTPKLRIIKGGKQ